MPTYVDVDLYGRETSAGVGIEYLDEDAVKNALELWLTSKKGDFLYNHGEGGVLDYTLFKNLSDANLRLLTFQIKNAFHNAFFPALEFNQVVFTPDYEARILEIDISYTNPASSISSTITLFVNTTYSYQRFSYEDIPYIGENLRNFCMVKSVDMTQYKLLYDMEDQIWKWGMYKFTNFNSSDPFFSDILAICNSQ
jgi:hypothetical protein